MSPVIKRPSSGSQEERGKQTCSGMKSLTDDWLPMPDYPIAFTGWSSTQKPHSVVSKV